MPRTYKRSASLWCALVIAATCAAKEPAKESVVDAPLPPTEAARTMEVPEGFHVTLFAGEPTVRQPISFCIDDRGRLWVAEAYNYPNHGTTAGDRILILEDVDGDGTCDKRTVFYDGLNYVTGIEVGFGGVWVMSPPYFYFIPDRDSDGKPDGEPLVLLDGFGNHANSHNLANGFAWGPDGWLYGTHGRTNWSMLGKPGTPDDQRIRFDGGVYRYHPVHHVWEPYADGTTNPWGIDWNDFGHAFVCNCVNPHLFQVIQGAHYEPWRNRRSSQHAYERIATIADHSHFVGGSGGVRAGLYTAEEDLLGGGHAHCGTMVYLGDNWPDRYRNSVFMNNIHGHRINNDLLTREGSGYTASHAADVMLARDPWYMGVTLLYGPNGAVFASDWSDTGECHSVTKTRRHTGRIYKISYGTTSFSAVDAQQLSNQQLVQAQLHKNDWHVRHARRLLQERAAAGQVPTEVHQRLRAMFEQQVEIPVKLRALWALHVTGGLDDEYLVSQLQHESEYVRSWAIKLLCEDKHPPDTALEVFRNLAASGSSQLVRLELASALQRLRLDQRWPIAASLAARRADADDANLPLMVWYGIEPLVHESREKFVTLAGLTEIPLIRRHVARRVASLNDARTQTHELIALLGQLDNDAARADVLTGMLEGFSGRRTVPMPPEWPDAYTQLRSTRDDQLKRLALEVAMVFDDPVALKLLRIEASDPEAKPPSRIRAIDSLVANHADDVAPLLLDLVEDATARGAALRGLAQFDHPATVETILAHYPSFDARSRTDAVQTLSSRRTWALGLLDAVQSNRIPRTDLTAFTGRQLRNLGDAEILARVNSLWGSVRSTAAEKRELIARHKRRLSPARLSEADLSSGRALFLKSCATCHRLFGEGQKVGPDITGAQRTNLDYLLENLFDPSAVVSRDYQMEVVETTGGRVVTGLVVAENENALTLQTLNEQVIIPFAEVDVRAKSNVSMMPDGLLNDLSSQQVRDLVAYLASPRPLRESAESAGDEAAPAH